jgi:glycosyltransferase involved in cell wall biosynthesis
LDDDLKKTVSVIICSHNPRPDYLGRVLDGLKAQTLARSEWELLLVDNASSQRLADVWDLSWHPRHAHIRENELGLTLARLRGIKEASGSLLLFLDDDNLPAPDYLERAVGIERMYPYLGVVGAGVLEPEFEIDPSPELVPLLGRLALRESSSRLWTNNPKDTHSVPWGAGLCVTRPIATAYVQIIERLKISHVLDRHGERLFCGGDDLFSWVSARNGCGFGVFPELRITHLIGAHRLNQSYFLRLVHDHAYSHGLLNYLYFGDEQPRPGVETVVRTLLLGVRQGWFSMRCGWAAARGARSATRYLVGQGMHPITHGERPTRALVLRTMLLLHSAGEAYRMIGNA